MPDESAKETEARLALIERAQDRIDSRLDGGAKAFETIRRELDTLVERTTLKPLPIWQILLAVFGVLGTLMGVWWQARGELDGKATTQEVQQVKSDTAADRLLLTMLKTTQEVTQRDVSEIKADVKEMMRKGR